ncbi:C2H2 type zinc finger domain containing protein [Pyrenophora tritici-repentis]|uniref:C2H2 type zinc finger domain containing protein n=2 Tax=Pyrenophora tritici-repentis TaxID=45151 RepID=A0A2W1H958_9PLEO|nr:C2H2 type zinc finger domain containing protein [Pyrenophora tritici-repentis Pt-1C-BFP]KAI1517430.1 C2H2 type zinc finger domain containing protein [Pyrenophora tritici-repentis]EDU46954.1 C2H2 type zinc finger domain containing protein [Pyrenophora tritici-repentis Pt-1C-BFP]KAI1670031.1 C2H2 type zinc finger domain containing protein [Pyrenophora tritici-repentis]KAI1681630.1 C2H2 type zinc finger domain containing protein [Pyrenophora tritici-repentis]PZD45690.1 C2H2 type zinc finger do
MDIQQRGRSPSTGQRIHKGHSPSPSPHAPFQHQHNANLGFEAIQDPSSYAVTSAGLNNAQFLTTTQGQPFSQQTSFADPGFFQTTQSISQHNTPQFGPQGSNNISPDPLDLTNTNNPDFNFFQSNALGQNQSLSSYLGNTLDPHLLETQSQQNQSVNPSELMHQMATAQHNAPTPPHLLPNMNSHQSPSPHASPNINQGPFRPPGHSRNTSLDPSAAYGTEWGQMAGASFGGHRSRGNSDAAFSDVASSVHNSPYLQQHDSFDNDQPSPLLNAQNDPQLFQDPVPGFDRFNLNSGNAHLSAGNSPHISPRLLPQNQQVLPQFQPETFGLNQNMNPYANPSMNGYSGQSSEPFPSLNQPMPEFGQADAMSPPEINIDFAPPSRQPSFEPPKPEHQIDALSPPDRSRSRNRMRAKSDPFSSASSRASTPGSEVRRSLSPNAAKSRSPSPSGKSSRRSSTSSVPNRDYILDLADPSRPAPADGSNPKRTQKHPATFQCTLCPKRFTRAYNLRSHLRTHTDERPFVCSVCGKAFARQHDRKRHEGLHSGEKKFVCRGNLKDGSNWGCGRRFARADALGRHFRSEAGRVCIRPLLEEEAREKGEWDGQNQQMNNGNGMFAPMPAQNFGGMMSGQPGFDSYSQPGGMQSSQQFLPAALLAQYPALAGIQWDQLPAGPPDEDGDVSGRSSFDASSGGEYYEEENEYQQGNHQTIYAGGNNGWVSDSYDGR